MFVLTVKGLVYYFLWFLSPLVTFQVSVEENYEQ